jgi:hypothetical protein
MQFGLFRTNGLLWSLALCALLTPLLDYLLPGTKYQWIAPKPSMTTQGDTHEKDRFMPRPAIRPVG